jgi:hypothetical protein
VFRRGARSRLRAASSFGTRVYIDGFNFYYAALRRAGLGQYKWLDLVAFCRAALPRNDVQLVQYFTAPLEPSRGRDGQRGGQGADLLSFIRRSCARPTT